MSTTPATPGPYSGTSIPATTPAAPSLKWDDVMAEAAAQEKRYSSNISAFAGQTPDLPAARPPGLGQAYTDEQLQAAIFQADGQEGVFLNDSRGGRADAEESVTFARAFLAALPKPAEPAPWALPAKASAEPEKAKPTQDELLAEAMRHPGVPDVEKAYGQQAKPAEKPCGFNSALDEWPADDGPPWIPHDGGPCPLKDEEVDEWELKYPNGDIDRTPGSPSAYRWRHRGDAGDIIEYRVTKPAPGHGPQPATFEAHGKVWIRHTPGDPCPCDPEASVQCLTSISGPTSAGKATYFGWKVSVHDENHWGVIIGWRYADEPAQAKAIPTEPEDKRLPPLNEADPVGHCAVEAACVHRKLDELGVPREEGGNELSLWGRVEEYAASKAEPEPAQAPGAPTEAAEAKKPFSWAEVMPEHPIIAEQRLAKQRASQPSTQPWTPKPGDVVRLKSGGPEMTVRCLSTLASAVVCDWFDGGGCFNDKAFPVASLQPSKEEARP